MALGDLTKQLAEQAIRSATQPSAAPAQESVGATIMAQIQAMQKALKEDEELVVLYHAGAEAVRVMEVYFPTWRVAVLTGAARDNSAMRVVAAVESVQLTCRVVKMAADGKPRRIGFVTPKVKG